MVISFIFSCLALAISPGPDNIYLAALTSRSGKVAGFSFLSGLIIGSFIHTTFLAFGILLSVSAKKINSDLELNTIDEKKHG